MSDELIECCAGLTPEEIEEQIGDSAVASRVPDIGALARYLAALAQSAVSDG